MRFQPPCEHLPVRSVGDVAGHHLDPLAALAGELAEPVAAAGSHQHVRTCLVQHAREPCAQTRRGAGHQRDPAIETPQVTAPGRSCRPPRPTHPHPR
jgi:hypothetical protein